MKKQFKKGMALVLAGALTLSLPQIPLKAAENPGMIYMEKETIQINHIGEERSTLFNEGWKFFLGESSNAQEVNFNDTSWRNVDLPHDYSVEQEFTVKGEAESGFLLGGTGWYRKGFTLSEDLADKNMVIDFDGVYMNATVYINGVKLGNHPYGYTAFSFDISDYVVCDGSTQNVIAVKVEHKTPSSRFYSGSGIYRDVHLNVTDPVHLEKYGTTVTTPSLESQKNGDVDVNIRTSFKNDSDKSAEVSVKNTIYTNTGEVVSESALSPKTAGPGQTAEVAQVLKVNRPALWSPENPALYSVKTEILKGEQVIDSYQTEFGFRYIKFDSNKGFFLNGKNVKLKGVCMHHDQGALGAKAYEDAIERQILLLKEMGCNSIRVTHNPAATALVELADRYGMMLIDEAFDTWLYPKNGNSNDYSQHFNKTIAEDNQIIGGSSDMTWAEFDMKEMVSRGKNSPSVIMWSIGNEVQEGIGGDTSSYPEVARSLINWGKEIDDTRPYTIGCNKVKGNDGTAVQMANVITELGGVVGMNYANSSQYQDRHGKSNWKLVGSETASSISSRGVYYTKGKDGSGLQLTAYDKQAVGWGALASSAWYDVVRNDFMQGEFVWTGFDYIGEPTPWNGTGSGSTSGQGPIPKSSFFGIIDTAGFPKDNFYLYQSMWNEDVNTLHVLPCWDRGNIVIENGKVEVAVYSDAAKVELYLNDKLVGSAQSKVTTTAEGHTYRLWQNGTAHNNQYATFQVPYEEGTLTAKAYNEDGTEITDTVGRKSVSTSEAPKKLQLSSTHSYRDDSSIDADGRSLSYIEVDVTDLKGTLDPDASNAVTFTLEGEGELVGTDNGNPADTTCYVPTSTSSTVRKAFNGKALAIVKSTKKAGGFTLTASADGLQPATIQVGTTEVPGMSEDGIISYTMSRHGYLAVGSANAPLPETVAVTYGDGRTAEKNIVWDSFDPAKLQEVGSFLVKGTIQDPESTLMVSFTVHVAGNIIGALNYSGITAAGTEPVLPQTLQTVLDSGNTYEEFPVTWENKSPEDFSVEGAIVIIQGTVNALGKSYPVTASIRVAEPAYGSKSNIAPEYLTLTQSCENASDNLLSITNGEKNSSPINGQNERWTNWNEMSKADNPYITFSWATAHLVDQINLYYYKENIASSQYPTSVTFEYSLDNTTWKTVDYEPATPAAAPAVTQYKLKTPINPIAIRIHMGHDTGKFIGLTEAEVISTAVSYPVNTQATLSELKTDGKDISGFFPDKFSYSVDAAAVTSASASQNAAVTILPEKDGIVRILVVSEDQKTTNLYSVELKNAANNYPKGVSLSAPSSEVEADDHIQLTPQVTDRDGKDVTAQSSFTYEVLLGPGAVSSGGLLTFTDSGQVKVRVRASFNGKEIISNTITIVVKERPPVWTLGNVSLKASSSNVYLSEKVQLTPLALNQFQADITRSCSITYKVTGAAAADRSGILSFKKPGTVTVYAVISYNGVTKNTPAVKITVKADKTTKLKTPSVKSVSSVVTSSGPKVKITVSKTVKGADTYTVYRKAGSKVTKLGSADKKGVIYDSKPLTDGKKAGYYAVATSKSSKYTNSSKSALKSLTLPKAPSKVTAAKQKKAVKVTWRSVLKAKEYLVFRSEKSSRGYRKIASVKNKLSYTDKKAKKGKTYYYAVVVRDSSKKYSGMKLSAKLKF